MQSLYNTHSEEELIMANHRPCVLYDRECIGCGECDRCDLDPEKICDNCMKCVTGEADYRSVAIDGFRLAKELQSNPDHYKQASDENQ